MLVQKLILNPISKAYLKQTKKFFFLNRRLKSIVADFLFTLAVFVPFLIVSMIPMWFSGIKEDPGTKAFDLNYVIFFIPYTLLIVALLNKDFYRGKSVAKRFYGYQIIDIKSNNIASPLKCMTRNITMVIWPIEVIAAWVNPKRRLGDFIAGTKLIDVDSEPLETLLHDMDAPAKYEGKTKLIFLSLITAILFNLFVVFPML
ncbi:hypothetical protein [Desertivirga xinjiangensis]|uniref:hypothetical protein n=1 Tax=Desertivirga xinjiangensis TaxID=539206 RepID=UPI0021099BC8|nr:hypothetical protein [Pedobacter xinjiangensis]